MKPGFLQLLSPALRGAPMGPGITLRAEPVELPVPNTEGGEAPRVDDLLVWRDEQATALRAAIIEVQLEAKEAKWERWVQYNAMALAQLGCEVVCVVVPGTDKIAEWAREPTPYGSYPCRCV